MQDKQCFVQFSHPGGEASPVGTGEVAWNVAKGHKRKFLRSAGEYRERADGPSLHTSDLGFWGEWEPQSYATPVRAPVPYGP